MLDSDVRLSNQNQNDSEALETDIMRFMAILGFCLMVIFALVQSIPQTGASQLPQMENKELLEQEMVELHQYTSKLKKELVQFKSVVKQEKEKVELMISKLSESQKSLLAINENLKKKQLELNESRKKINKQKRVISKVNEQFEVSRTKLDKTEKQALAQKIKNNINDYKAEKKEREYEKQQEVARLTKDLDSKPIKKTDVMPNQVGFSLSFESNSTLLSLINNNHVQFYAVNQKQSFLVMPNGKVTLKAIKGPFYQMSEHTIPIRLINGVKNRITVTNKTEYGVTLPVSISQQINKIVNSNKGGKLVIDQNGIVNFVKFS